ncbi:hypothetical protein D3C75_1253500 [compost metagenome]
MIGLQEEEVKTDRGTFDFLDLNRRANLLFTEKGARVAYEEADGKHIWGFWQTKLSDGIRHFLMV